MKNEMVRFPCYVAVRNRKDDKNPYFFADANPLELRNTMEDTEPEYIDIKGFIEFPKIALKRARKLDIKLNKEVD